MLFTSFATSDTIFQFLQPMVVQDSSSHVFVRECPNFWQIRIRASALRCLTGANCLPYPFVCACVRMDDPHNRKYHVVGLLWPDKLEATSCSSQLLKLTSLLCKIYLAIIRAPDLVSSWYSLRELGPITSLLYTVRCT